MSLKEREALIDLLAKDPAILAAYVLDERPLTNSQQLWSLQVGVLYRAPDTCRVLTPRDKAIRRLDLARRVQELLGLPVTVVDLDNADRHQLRRVVVEGLLLYVRAGGESAHRAFENYARRRRGNRRFLPARLSRNGGKPAMR